MFKSVKFIVVCACALLVGCQTVPDTPKEQTTLRQEADSTLAKALRQNPYVETYVTSSIAYAIFPTVGKGGLIVAGGYGKGILFEKGTMVGYCDATQLSVGAIIGGQSFSELVFIQTPDALEKFKSGDLALDAKVSAIAMDKTATKEARYQNGVAVIFVDPMGLMAEASAGGQKFRYVAADLAE